jgi:hypothetical protein
MEVPGASDIMLAHRVKTETNKVPKKERIARNKSI